MWSLNPFYLGLFKEFSNRKIYWGASGHFFFIHLLTLKDSLRRSGGKKEEIKEAYGSTFFSNNTKECVFILWVASRGWGKWPAQSRSFYFKIKHCYCHCHNFSCHLKFDFPFNLPVVLNSTFTLQCLTSFAFNILSPSRTMEVLK